MIYPELELVTLRYPFMDFKQVIKVGQLELWQKYCKRMRENPKLTYLFWETTLRCNLSCQHCGSSCSPQTRTNDLSTSEIKACLQKISRDFPGNNIILAITGGEPLLREDIFEIIKDASRCGFKCGMVTNGTLLTKKTALKLKESGLRSISISLDGTEKSHEFLRGKSNFQRAVEGIKNILEVGLPVVEIITCVYPGNIDELEEILKFLKDINVKNWRLFNISPIGRARERKDLLLGAIQLKQLLDFIKEKRKKDKEMTISFMEEGFLGTQYEGEVRESYFVCWAGIQVGSILHDGSISACPSLPREFVQGNIKRDDFKKVWEEKFKEFRKVEWRRSGRCLDCCQWDYCHGNGMHLWDFVKKEPSLCQYQMLINSREVDKG